MTPTFAIGILTCDRPQLFKQCVDSLRFVQATDIIIVNTGIAKLKDVPKFVSDTKVSIFENSASTPQSIASGKNLISRFFLERTQADYVYIIEDDVKVIKPKIFYDYMELSQESNLQHLMWGSGGPNNLKENPLTKIKNFPDIKFGIEYTNQSCLFYKHCVGMFTMYSRKLLEKIGLFDEEYVNSVEHIDHSYRAVKDGFLPFYGCWPDSATSHECLLDLDPNFENSTMKEKNRVNSNVLTSVSLFQTKHGFSPYAFPNISLEDLVTKLKEIKEKS